MQGADRQARDQAAAKHLPAEWSTDKNVAWKAKLPGYGWSSPITWGDKVFVTTAVSSKQTKPGGFGGFGRGGFGGVTYSDLMTATDAQGVFRSYLATEENFEFMKSLEAKNMLVPVVGNFAGPKAIRAVGKYVKEKDDKVVAFYLSNVEQYLQQDGIWDDFCRNVATLPLNESSTFIRSVRGGRFGFGSGLNSDLGNMSSEVSHCAPEKQK